LEVLRHRSFRAIFIASVTSFAAWGTTTALALHLGTYFWQVTPLEMIYWGAAEAAGTLLGLLWWPRRAAAREKHRVYMLGMALYVALLAGPTFLRMAGAFPAPGSALYLFTWIATTGLAAHFGLAACMVTGGSMMADVADLDELRHGRRREGVFFGAVSFAAKASAGLGGAIAGFVVDWADIPAGTAPGDAGADAVWKLGLSLGVAIGALCGFAVWMLSRYDLTRRRHDEIRRALAPGG
jgi:GPH family glycoside/pentoside/hexuronide:cation symporter